MQHQYFILNTPETIFWYVQGAKVEFVTPNSTSAPCILGMLKIYAWYTTSYQTLYGTPRMHPFPENSKILLRIHMRTQNRPYHKYIHTHTYISSYVYTDIWNKGNKTCLCFGTTSRGWLPFVPFKLEKVSHSHIILCSVAVRLSCCF